MNEDEAGIRSLWADTAAPAPDTAPLGADAEADVAVVGAGYAGLSVALHLAEAGRSVVVLEAGAIGAGSSGRSGGQVIPGVKHDPAELEAMLGPEAGGHAAELFGATADAVFDLIERHGIECDAVRAGWLQPAHSPAALTTARRRAEDWAARGADVEVLDAEGMAALLGTDEYLGGWIDRRGGSVQPLSYVRGLARAAMAAGARMHTGTRVTALRREGPGWELGTAAGATVRAGRVVLATNAYSDALWPGLARSVVAVNSFQVATGPLSGNLDATILPTRAVASDTRRLLSYWRRDAGGRLVLGARGTFRDPRAANDFAHIERTLRRRYPALSERPIAFRWGGRVAMTPDHLPHLHEPEPGLVIPIGCQGRGVGLQSATGRWIAEYLLRGDPRALPLPVTPLRTIPLHGLRRLYVAAMLAYYKLRDAAA